MKWSTLGAALVVGLVWSGGWGVARAKTKVVFFDLASQPSTKQVATRINRALRSWVGSSDGLSSVYGQSLAETRGQYCKTAKLKRSFHTCLAHVATQLKVDRLVVGSVLPEGKGYRVVLTVIDPSAPQKPKTITERLSADNSKGPALGTWIQRWFRRLFTSAQGFLVVSCNVDRVSMRVDDRYVGRCGTGVTRIKVPAGRHQATFYHERYVTAVRQLAVKEGGTTRLEVTLHSLQKSLSRPRPARPAPVTPPPPSPPPSRTGWKVAFYSVLGTGTALLLSAIGTGFHAAALRAERNRHLAVLIYNNEFAGDINDPCNTSMDEQYVALCNDARRVKMITYTLVGTGAALVALSSVFLYYAYLRRPKRSRESSARRAGLPQVTVLPQVWAGGGGLSATLRY